MKTAAQRLSNVIKEGISPILKENGFKKKGLHYYKKGEDIGYAFNIQKDKWNSKDEIRFTFNLGIYSEKYWLSKYGDDNTSQAPDFPKEIDCIIRERIGMLKYGKDYWYGVTSIRLERSLIKEVKLDIENYILSFFNKIHSNQALIDYLKDHLEEYGNDTKLKIIQVRP